jgi:hypothetical protein
LSDSMITLMRVSLIPFELWPLASIIYSKLCTVRLVIS